MVRDSSVGTCAIQQAKVGEAIEAGIISVVQRRALQLSYIQIRS